MCINHGSEVAELPTDHDYRIWNVSLLVGQMVPAPVLEEKWSGFTNRLENP